ncbi:MAG: 2-hydroxyglutaryl-CoA dehydratase [Candidatus Omnitrophica bacterium]|nr:2-hydroxyglutaryl-CoA dehydratase [Candidatus Omnitrophota bacterium]
MYFLGIDVGSITTKALLLNEKKEIVSSHIMKTGAEIKKTIAAVCDSIFAQNHITQKEIPFIVSTGYGRKNVDCAQKYITEITAHAFGATYYFPRTRLILDIGGQDTKVVALTAAGNVDDFIMNDKCAAGTGRFLDVMADILNTPITQLGEKALGHTKELKINNTCTVFAESEVISLIAREERIEDIAFAIHDSIVDRIINLVNKISRHGEITLSGGVSKNSAIQELVKKRLNTEVNLPMDPQIIGALGAAILAHRHFFHNK